MKLQPEPLLYRDWLNLRMHLLWCYDHAVGTAREQTQVHQTSEYINNGAWLVRSGWAQVKYGSHVMRAETGQWLIVKPGKRIQSFAPKTELLSVAFEATWPDGTAWLEPGLPLVLVAARHPALEKKAKPMVNILKSTGHHEWDARQYPVDYRQFLTIERHLKDWFLVLLDALKEHRVHPHSRSNIDERVMNAVDLLDAHPVGEPLDQEVLARQAGVSLVHLSRLFQQNLNTTPRHYFEKRRLDYAFRRLRMSDVRIKEVAITLGFKHLSHFSKWFKQYAGSAPRNFAKAESTTGG